MSRERLVDPEVLRDQVRRKTVLGEISRVLKPDGRLQFADIANGRPVPPGGHPRRRPLDRLNRRRAARAGWQTLLEASGFTDVTIGEAVDTFGGAKGEANARTFEVYGYAFSGVKDACLAIGRHLTAATVSGRPRRSSAVGNRRECDGTRPCTTVACK